MKYQANSKYRARINSENTREEEMIIKAIFKPGDYLVCKGHSLRVSYSEVRDGELVYLAYSRSKSYWIPERLTVDSDQIQ